MKRLDFGIGGYQSNLGYPEGWQLHELKGDIYLQCPKRELIDLPKAEECFLAAAKYADTSNERAMALTAAAVAAYNQGRMELAETYAQQACESDRDMAEAHFQLARIRLNRCNYSEAWQAALQAIILDHRYAARLPLDSEFERNAEQINPAWRQYGEELQAPLEAAAQSAAATMHELAKSREQTNSLRNAPAFAHLDLPMLAKAKERFQQMTELVNTLSSEAEKSLNLLADSLRENSVFAFLEVESEAQRANDLTTGALAAAREANLTIHKVEELSQGMPRRPKVFLPEPVNNALVIVFFLTAFGFLFMVLVIAEWASGANIGNTDGLISATISVTLIFLALALGHYFFVDHWHWFVTKAHYKWLIEKFDWSTANAPQTTAETDGTISRANEAMRIKRREQVDESGAEAAREIYNKTGSWPDWWDPQEKRVILRKKKLKDMTEEEKRARYDEIKMGDS